MKKILLILLLLTSFLFSQPYRLRFDSIKVDHKILLPVGGLQDSTTTLADFTTAAYNYIGSGGSITNNPDDITLENKAGSTIGITHEYLTDSVGTSISDSLSAFNTAQIYLLTSGKDTLTGITGTLTAYYVKFENAIASGSTIDFTIYRDATLITTAAISTTSKYLSGTDSEAISNTHDIYVVFDGTDLARGNLYDIKVYLKILGEQ